MSGSSPAPAAAVRCADLGEGNKSPAITDPNSSPRAAKRQRSNELQPSLTDAQGKLMFSRCAWAELALIAALKHLLTQTAEVLSALRFHMIHRKKMLMRVLGSNAPS